MKIVERKEKRPIGTKVFKAIQAFEKKGKEIDYIELNEEEFNLLKKEYQINGWILRVFNNNVLFFYGKEIKVVKGDK